MMYEAFMAEYGLMLDEVDERFSFRQMTLLLEARNRRKKNESKVLANEVWVMAFGTEEPNNSTPSMVTYTGNQQKSLSFFGIGEQKRR